MSYYYWVTREKERCNKIWKVGAVLMMSAGIVCFLYALIYVDNFLETIR